MSVLSLCCQGAEIRRLWGFHDVLLCVDFALEDNKEMVDLLLQCLLNINYIKNDDVSVFYGVI